jgi:hypothetical protein
MQLENLHKFDLGILYTKASTAHILKRRLGSISCQLGGLEFRSSPNLKYTWFTAT